MANDATRKTSYFNTLIFTILAGIISLILLVLLFFKNFKQYLPFIITLEIGIFSMIAWCIIQIYINEKLLNKLRKNLDYQISFNSCPDYFTKRLIGEQEICSNEYIYIDDKKQRRIMKVYPADDKSGAVSGMRPLPATLSMDYKGNEKKWEKFPLNELENESSFKTYTQKCAPLFQAPSDSKLKHLKGYDLVPWTNARSQCSIVQPA